MRRRGLAALAFAASLAACAPHPVPHFTGSVLTPKPAPDFTLTDENGSPFRLSGQRGNAVILFFGYTHCPDVCPATMAQLHRAYELVPAAERARVRVVFVTVDPERDGTRALARFVRLFDPTFVGLTGSEDALAPVEDAYHVFHQRIPGTTSSGYLIAHTGAVYLIDPAGDLRVMHGWQDSARSIASDVEQLLS